jgi:hypothetical protein
MRRLIIIPVVALALGVAACGEKDPTVACQKEFGPATVAVGNSDEERYCVNGKGNPVGEVENDGMGWTADD